MNNINAKVNDIYLKVQNLIQLQGKLAAENQLLVTKNQELEGLLIECELKMKRLEEKSKVVRIAQSLSTKPNNGSQDLKLRINELVREVDKCIAILNS